MAALLVGVGCSELPPSAGESAEMTLVQAAGDTIAPDPAGVRVASAGGDPARLSSGPIEPAESQPAWAARAIFYQIFPERFRNGDPSNDPTRESLEFPEQMPDNWELSPWTGDWYARAEWEHSGGDNFYEHGVFDRRYGGDLQGIIDRLEYLHDLGVNAIYLNPVFYARSLHKYDGNTYHHIDPHFGPDPAGDFALMKEETSDPATWNWTAADRLFVDLVRQAHELDIRVIIDGVFNHTGRNFFAFEDLVERQEASPYRDWYIVHDFDNPDTPANEFRYKGWWGVLTLPEFADNEAGDDLHPGPKEYVFDATRRWMDPNGDGDPSDGIDGWRLDVAAEVPTKFWADWNAHCRRINPECYTVAEHWDDAAKFLADGGFSATMNYHGFAFLVKGYLIDGALSASDCGRMLRERMDEFPESRRYALQNLIDSHDTDRVASMIVNAATDRPYVQPHRSDYDVNERVSPRYWDQYQVRKPNAAERRVQRLVALMQATFVGAPMIYYGDEAGMWGGDDPCDRLPMVWDDLTYDDQKGDPLGRERTPDKVEFDAELHAYYRAAMALRSECPALNDGDFEVIATDDAHGVLAFRRSNRDESLYVVFNRGDGPAKIQFAVGADPVVEVFTASGAPHLVAVEHAGESVSVALPGVEGVVLRQAHAPE